MELQHEKNAYRCEKCKGEIVTVNLSDGVTPFMIRCRANWPGECGGMAQSRMYNIDQSRPALWGWYTPDAEALAKLDSETQEHVRKGGLILRKLDGAERVMHGGASPRSDGS